MRSLRFGPAALAMSAALASAASADDFYNVTAADLNGPPGSLIRYLGLNTQITGAMAYRILYRSTGLDGKPIAVSGMIVAPDRSPPAGGWPVIAWAHPTTGIARKCAPSAQPDPVASIQGINDMLGRFVVVATDYPGLGTPGMHPYLVGESEGRAVLDSVRAARELDVAKGGDRFVVWGHSQGGHASLWTGELAASYAPELKLLGVAAAAPASELGALFEDDLTRLDGRILGGLVVDSWSKVYGAPGSLLFAPSEAPALALVAEDCIDVIRGELGDLSANKELPKKFLIADPTKVEPWKGLIEKNTPGRAAAGAPVFISQGTADEVVDPPVTVEFVKLLCRQGTTVKFVEYPGVTHGEIGVDSARQAIEWMVQRFEGKPAPSTCGG